VKAAVFCLAVCIARSSLHAQSLRTGLYFLSPPAAVPYCLRQAAWYCVPSLPVLRARVLVAEESQLADQACQKDRTPPALKVMQLSRQQVPTQHMHVSARGCSSCARPMVGESTLCVEQCFVIYSGHLRAGTDHRKHYKWLMSS